MTVSANFAFEMTRDGIIRRAMQRAQLLHPDGQPQAGYIAMAADFLSMELQSLAAEGVTLYQKEYATLTLTAGTDLYALTTPNDDAIDIVITADGVAGSISDATDQTRTPVMALTPELWTQIPDRLAEAAKPTHVTIEKLSPLLLTFHPIPTEVHTFIFWKVRLIRDVDTGAVTMDVARRWQKYIWLELAAQLAGAASKPESFVGQLSGLAKAAKEEAKRSDREMVGGQWYVPRYNGGCI